MNIILALLGWLPGLVMLVGCPVGFYLLYRDLKRRRLATFAAWWIGMVAGFFVCLEGGEAIALAHVQRRLAILADEEIVITVDGNAVANTQE